MKQTIVVNLFGGQGAGKSTAMAGVFNYLKNKGVDCEMAPEFAKELVWEGRKETFSDELYMFAKQHHRLQRLNGKVDVVITDHPLILSSIYNYYYNPVGNEDWNNKFSDLVSASFNLYNNLNFVIKRVKPYNENGRNESREEAEAFDQRIEDILLLRDDIASYSCVNGDENAAEIIGQKVLSALG